MAIYHLSVKTISRSHGRSATAAAAYRSAERIVDERTGEIHDYTRKQGVLSRDLILPKDAPGWAVDRAALWNAAEQSETRKNSTVAREFEIALPAELDAVDRRALAVSLAEQLVERHRCAADVSIHAPDRRGDERNHHAHILLTTRRLEAEGFTEKTRELDDVKSGEVKAWRERFANLQNERLLDLKLEIKVSAASLKEQQVDREANRHIGPTATAIERRTGEPSRLRGAFAAEAQERQASRGELIEVKRQVVAVEHLLIDTQSSLAAALRERQVVTNKKEAPREQMPLSPLERLRAHAREHPLDLSRLRAETQRQEDLAQERAKARLAAWEYEKKLVQEREKELEHQKELKRERTRTPGRSR